MTNRSQAYDLLIAPARTGAPGNDAPRSRKQKSVTDMFPQQPLDPETLDAVNRFVGKIRDVKRSRFNAQSRYDAKSRASIIALSIASILSIAIPMYISLRGDASGFAELKLSLEFIASAMSLLVLSFGFIVALGNYQDKSIRLQICALDLGRLIDLVEFARHDPRTPRAQLTQWATAYNDILEQCPYNHDDVDFEKAKLGYDSTRIARWRVSFYWYADVWGIHAFFGLILATFWVVAG
jgi:hypothetical protein